MQADDIRDFVFVEYIKGARRYGKCTVIIRSGDVHEKMGFSGRMPAVCGAIGTKKFEKKYNVRLIKREGLTHGPNVFFTFEV